MSNLKLYFALYYLTNTALNWRGEDHKARQIVRAVKGEEYNGYFESKVSGAVRRYSHENADEFLSPMCGVIGGRLKSIAPPSAAIVPIPNSDASILDKGEFRTLKLATLLSRAIPGSLAVPALRWAAAKQPAHQGGARDQDVYFRNLRVAQRTDRPVILFDDVKTTGAQLIAATRRLEAAGMKPVFAVTVGVVTHEQKSPMIEWRSEEIQIPDA